jgi:hypothetical protein
MRLQLRVNNKFYYDIGLRKGLPYLSKTHEQFGIKCPRFLEDFIEEYGKNNIKVIAYGSLKNEKDYINGLLK